MPSPRLDYHALAPKAARAGAQLSAIGINRPFESRHIQAS
jgi:hypothetical protein